MSKFAKNSVILLCVCVWIPIWMAYLMYSICHMCKNGVLIQKCKCLGAKYFLLHSSRFSCCISRPPSLSLVCAFLFHSTRYLCVAFCVLCASSNVQYASVALSYAIHSMWKRIDKRTFSVIQNIILIYSKAEELQ